MRIYAFAKELGLDNKQLLDICENCGIKGKGSALASLDEDEVAKIKAFMSEDKSKPAETVAASAATTAATTTTTTTDDEVNDNNCGGNKNSKAGGKSRLRQFRFATSRLLTAKPVRNDGLLVT